MHSWGFGRLPCSSDVQHTWCLPLVGHCICVLRNTLCLRLKLGVGALGRLLKSSDVQHTLKMTLVFFTFSRVPRLHSASTLDRHFPSRPPDCGRLSLARVCRGWRCRRRATRGATRGATRAPSSTSTR
eukprot:2871719-Pyramimonas_sp.AAC.1